jgi:cellulose synthase/poly-beta-1,6-N-acetylglucosamine synthase-like glycosyltransferase
LRRAALNEMGGWDAHNVTEDADLGIRIARHGYRTDMLPSVTYEEANIRV